VSVAPGGALAGVLARGGTDGVGRFRLDELLQDALTQHPDRLDSVGRTYRLQQPHQVRLGQGHRVLLRLNWPFTRETCAMACLMFREQSPTVGARPGQTPARSTPLTDYTTRWDAILAGGLRTALGSGYSRPSWWTARERMDWSMLSVHSTRLATAFCRWPTPCPCSAPVVREEAVHR